MSATLSAGINSLILKLDTPYDTIRLTDIRDDLIKVKVWCSASSGFTPIDTGSAGANQVFDGLSLSITISGLPNGTATPTPLVGGTPYYVKYAFISEIDEAVQTVSAQLTATPGKALSTPKYATASIYKWASVAAPNPTGSSTYTWLAGTNTAYTATATDGWDTVVPTNPGTSSLKLWSATKTVTDVADAISTPVDWTTGVMIGSIGGNGALGMTGTSGVSGVNAVTVNVYKAGLNLASVGSPTGQSLYTWADASFAAPSDATWTKDPPLPSSSNYGLTLWAARVTLIESASTPTTQINWASAAIVPVSYYGANGPTGSTSTVPGPSGASARVAYVVTSAPYATPAGTPANKEETGDVVPAVGTWFPGKTWLTNAPATPLVAGEYLYQVDGLYNPVTNKTNWIGIPYLSNLKVGNLSALSVNTGALLVTDTITVTGDGTNGVLIKTDGIYIYNAGVLRVKLGSI